MRKKTVIPEVMDIRLEWWKSEIRGENSIYETARKRAESGEVTVENTTAQEFAIMVKFGFLSPKKWKELKRDLSSGLWNDKLSEYEIYNKIVPELQNTIFPRLYAYNEILSRLYERLETIYYHKIGAERFVKSQNELLSILGEESSLVTRYLEETALNNKERKEMEKIIERNSSKINEILTSDLATYLSYSVNEKKLQKIEERGGEVFEIENGSLVISRDYFEGGYWELEDAIPDTLAGAKGFILAVEKWIFENNLSPFIEKNFAHLCEIIKSPVKVLTRPQLFAVRQEELNSIDKEKEIPRIPKKNLIPDYYSIKPDEEIYKQNILVYYSLL